MPRAARHALFTAALIGGAAGTADAQRVIEGFARIDQSDVTGPSVTSGDQLAPLFAEPGTVRSMACPVAWGVRTAANRTQVMLASAGLERPSPVTGAAIPASAQRAVYALLTDDGSAGDAVLLALTAGNQGATRQARRLVAEARGLFSVMSTLDPLRPGRAAPTQLARVTGAYNAFLDASSDAFISRPPAELLALHAVLDEMVGASIQNEGRPANVADVDAAGLACAGLAVTTPPVVPVTPVVPVPADQPFEMCVLVNGDFRIVSGLRTPQGDSVAVENGQRIQFASLYPAAERVDTPPWVSRGEPVTIGGRQYQPFGINRTVRPGEVVRTGFHDGYEYFSSVSEPDAGVIYFVSARDCVVQPYRSAETIRVRG